MIQIFTKVVFSTTTTIFIRILIALLLPPTLHLHHPPPYVILTYFCSFVFPQVRKIGCSFAQAHFRLWWNECGHYQLDGRGGWKDTFAKGGVGWIDAFATVYVIYVGKTTQEDLDFTKPFKRTDIRGEQFWIKIYIVLFTQE